MLGDELAQPFAAGTQFGGRQLGCLGGRPLHDVGDPDASGDEVGPVVVGHAVGSIDVALDHATEPECRIEPVAGVSEVGLRGRGPETRIDADEQQPEARADQVGHGHVTCRFEFGAAETHAVEGTADRQDGHMVHPFWPLFDVEVRTPRLRLRAVTDELAVELATLAARGVHDPSFSPFYVPWTDLEPPALQRGVLQFHWRSRADTTPTNWRVPFAVESDGQIVGSTDLAASDFPVLRQFETGSWLGREFQGQGLGRELRIATLAFGFLGLDAERATTGAWHDNQPSLGVTRSLGYEPSGSRRAVRRDRSDTLLGFHMDRSHYLENVHRDDIEIDGDDAVRELLGLSR